MGVALENARLFDETKRLLAETNERAAELAVINEIGQALASQLDFEAIVQLVGERIREIFTARIDLHRDPRSGDRHAVGSRTTCSNGEPVHTEPLRVRTGPERRSSSETGKPLRLSTPRGGPADRAAAMARVDRCDRRRARRRVVARRADPRAATGSSASSPSSRRERDAFDEADERLLSTLAASMGVALENARLFDETKRLLAETNQRAAELAVINEIGAALARQLDFAGDRRARRTARRRDLRRRSR